VRCVITGAADGIGRSLAEVFATAGYAITGIDVDSGLAEERRHYLKGLGAEIHFLIYDLSQADEVAKCAADLVEGGPIDVLIQNAGISAAGRMTFLSLDDQLRVIRVNLSAPMLLTAGLLKAGKMKSGGSMVFMSSLSHFVGYPGASVYAATKDGIASYARSLRQELRRENVHVLTVYPGPTRTAHARRYSVDNTREHNRMHPDELARRIYQSVVRRRRTLIPGVLNGVMARVGKWLPGVTERAMARSMLGSSEPNSRRIVSNQKSENRGEEE
jgi:short-subunit dehydrogenase